MRSPIDSTQRYTGVAFYRWSEDKARQYFVPERADFGAFISESGTDHGFVRGPCSPPSSKEIDQGRFLEG